MIPRPTGIEGEEDGMKSGNGWYWIAAGVLALGLNGAYLDGALPWVGRAADAPKVMTSELLGHALGYLTNVAQPLPENGCPRAQAAMAHAQARIARLQAEAANRRFQRSFALQHERLAVLARQMRIELPQVRIDVPMPPSNDAAAESSSY
jgi:hypothetical protein